MNEMSISLESLQQIMNSQEVKEFQDLYYCLDGCVGMLEEDKKNSKAVKGILEMAEHFYGKNNVENQIASYFPKLRRFVK